MINKLLTNIYQLNCVRGNACGVDVDVVQCHNVGGNEYGEVTTKQNHRNLEFSTKFDYYYYQIQWKCEADLEAGIKFGELQVTGCLFGIG